jgi:hypothetical protein
MKQKLSELIRSPRILILVAPFVLMAPVWLAGKAIYWGTPSTQFVPWWWQAWQTLQSGELPLWNPLVGMGAPLFANYQSALLYPPTWIYFGLAAIGGLSAMAWGQAILVALHLAWAGWGMGLLIRRFGKSELAQTVGGLAFGLSGYLVARAHFLSINAAVAWLPWILLAAYDLVHYPRNKRALLRLALLLALQWLAGHAQIAWYTLLLTIAWTAFWAWQTGRCQSLGRSAVRFGMAGLLAFGLSAAQLLPTAEYLLNSQRATQVDFTRSATYSFWPWRLIGLVAPNFFGNPAQGNYNGYGNFWEDAIYVGLLPLLLAIAAIWWARKQTKQKSLIAFLLGLIGISFILALGNNTPVFEWLYKYAPTFALFQSPTRFTIWLVFALAMLAALAVDQWKPPRDRALYWSRLGVAGSVAIILGGGAGWMLAEQGAIVAPQSYFSTVTLMGVLALASAWLHLRSPRNGGGTAQWVWLVSGLVAADLLLAGWGLNPGTSLELYKEDVNLRTDLRVDLGNGRLFISEPDDYELRYEHLFQFSDFFASDPELIRSSLVPNTAILTGIPSANNYDPLVPNVYRNWMDQLNQAGKDERQDLLAQMGVSVVEEVDLEATPQISFQPIETLSRARWMSCTETVLDLIECEVSGDATAEIMRNTANTVSIAVTASSEGWLVLADTNFPGWRALSNGEELPIVSADGIFRAVRLPVGQFEVKFVYQPVWFFAGIALTVVSWAILLILWRITKKNEL